MSVCDAKVASESGFLVPRRVFEKAEMTSGWQKKICKGGTRPGLACPLLNTSDLKRTIHFFKAG